MLLTHIKPNQLLGKKVYDAKGRYLGQVIAITRRKEPVRKVFVHRASRLQP